MISLSTLTKYLQKLLQPEKFQDYAPNGLQIEGGDNVRKIISGVSASQALFDIAVLKKADVVLVHHGLFWQGEDPRIIGIKKKRISALIKKNISLIAYHLPLDAHHVLGNNAQLAKIFDLNVNAREPTEMVFSGSFKKPMSGEDFAKLIGLKLKHKPLYLPGKTKEIKTIAWCSGGAQSYIDQAIDLQVDAYLTGEISEKIVHIARENGLHFYAAGHHATERYGIKALGEHLAEKFPISHQFIDIDNPV
jgi:dinuclear metal center YbgI/SA1388 family protein